MVVVLVCAAGGGGGGGHAAMLSPFVFTHAVRSSAPGFVIRCCPRVLAIGVGNGCD